MSRRSQIPAGTQKPDSDAAFWGRAASLPQVENPATEPSQPQPSRPELRPEPKPRITPPPPSFPQAPPTKTARPKPRRRNRWPRRIAILLTVLLIVGLLGTLYAAARFRQLERVELGGVLTPVSQNVGTNYLIVGSDSREGIAADVENAGAILGEGAPTGQRSDTLLILRVEPSGTKLMSIPRDLWLPISGTGGSQRINTAFAGGAERVIATVQDSLGIPIHHYMEIDFVNFSNLVDALGGITIDFANPASDKNSGLNVQSAGAQELTGPQALAFVRSRYYVEQINGQPVADGTGDLGRVQRQQAFLSALMAKVGGTRNPLRLNGVSGALASGVKIDDQLGLVEALRMARRVSGTAPESVVLPTYPYRTSGGAAVLGLTDEAPEVIATFQP